MNDRPTLHLSLLSENRLRARCHHLYVNRSILHLNRCKICFVQSSSPLLKTTNPDASLLLPQTDRFAKPPVLGLPDLFGLEENRVELLV